MDKRSLMLAHRSLLERHPAGRQALARLEEGRVGDAHCLVNIQWILEGGPVDGPTDLETLLDKLCGAED